MERRIETLERELNAPDVVAASKKEKVGMIAGFKANY